MFNAGPAFLVSPVAPNGATSAFDPAGIGTSTTLSNSNRTGTISGSNITSRARSLASKAAGKWYAEFNISSITGSCSRFCGVVSTGNLNNQVGFGATDWGYGTGITNNPVILNSNSNAAYGTAFGVNDTIGIAIDFTAGKIWFANNNVWQASGNPVSGANPAFTGVAGTLFPCVSAGTSGAGTVVWNSPAAQKYAPPSGYSVWS